MNSINKQALDYLDKIDLNKVKIIAFDGNFDVNILKIEEAYDGHYSITYSWGDFSITEKVHIDDTNINQLIIEQVLNGS